ncbi:MAG TPA: hypothetical protein VFW96_08010, partial [Thermomicrobiales bacterium]|nr:hypothetical protein [Thermomicrobiales bacterium]
NVTCLVFSPGEPTNFAGRGQQAEHATAQAVPASTQGALATTCIDVRDFVPTKMAAMAAHHSQYPVTRDMFPRAMVEELLGHEYFVQILPPLGMQATLLPEEQHRDGDT